jgi:hypothetical protein
MGTNPCGCAHSVCARACALCVCVRACVRACVVLCARADRARGNHTDIKPTPTTNCIACVCVCVCVCLCVHDKLVVGVMPGIALAATALAGASANGIGSTATWAGVEMLRVWGAREGNAPLRGSPVRSMHWHGCGQQQSGIPHVCAAADSSVSPIFLVRPGDGLNGLRTTYGYFPVRSIMM